MKTSKTITIERKTFVIETAKNHIGSFIRITETVAGHSHRNTIVLPASGASELGMAITEAGDAIADTDVNPEDIQDNACLNRAQRR